MDRHADLFCGSFEKKHFDREKIEKEDDDVTV
jgi:hypothetical protein